MVGRRHPLSVEVEERAMDMRKGRSANPEIKGL
jgi:hypothetical protein